MMHRLRPVQLIGLGIVWLSILVAGRDVSTHLASSRWGRRIQVSALAIRSAQAASIQATNRLVVIAFSDTTGPGPFACPGCQKTYSRSDRDANDRDPLPEMEFVLRRADTGEEVGRQLGQRDSLGRIRAVFQVSPEMGSLILDLARGPAGFQLCPNSTSTRTIHPEDFILGAHEEIYPFWKGCSLKSQPMPTTTPTETSPPPTSTPMPPTATPTPAEQQIVVEAFLDVTGPGGLACPGCDRIYSSSDQAANAANPLPNMDFLLKEADTDRLLARQTTTLDTQGRARTTFRVPGDLAADLVVELASSPPGFELCPNMSLSRTIHPDDFILGTHLEQFPFWRGCELPSPTPTRTVVVPAEASPTAPRATPTVVKPQATPTVAEATASPAAPATTGVPMAATPQATPRPSLPITGSPVAPLWGFLALGAAVLLALSHAWRWTRAAFAAETPTAVPASSPRQDERADRGASSAAGLMGLAVALIGLGLLLLRSARERSVRR